MSLKRNKTPWPTDKAMAQIYRNKLWGDNGDVFYSGEGSHETSIISPYLRDVSKFLDSFEEPISVCDLGCGDFNIGKQLVHKTKRYIAVDIVPELIEHNKLKFQSEKLKFVTLDIVKDDLPMADCLIIRQVLQHLSNAEVIRILQKIKKYKYIILTEHVPNGDYIPNLDIISGQGIRIKKKSGLDILKPPFDFKCVEKVELASIALGEGRGHIQTYLFYML